MRTILLLLSLLLASGCACPDSVGEAGELSFRVCAAPDAPVMRGSTFEISLSPDQDPGVAVWTAPDAAVSVASEAEGSSFTAQAVGSGRIQVELEDGRSDSLQFEVAEADSVVWQDPWWNAAEGLIADSEPADVVGTALPSHPGATVQLFTGGATDLTVDVLDATGRSLQWSSAAVVFTDAAEDPDGSTGILRGPGVARAETAEGVELGTIEVVAVESLDGATLSVAAWAPPREAGAGGEGLQEWTSYLRAVVTAANGEPVFGVPLEWTVTGAGSASTWFDDDGSNSVRRDLASYAINTDDGIDRSACVVASAEGLDPVSIWFSVDGNSVHEDGTCGGQDACAGCTAVGSRDASWLALLGLAALVRRRRY